MSAISHRATQVAASATAVITQRAAELRAAGEDVIGFGAGEPDFPTPAHIVAAAQEAARDPLNHHYSAIAGLEQLRVAVAAKTKRDFGYQIDPAQVLVTNGAKMALYVACQTILDQGDEVLVPAPYWVSYPEIVKLAGGEPVAVFAGSAQGYRVTIDQLERSRSDRTKALLFVSPSNPTGAVYRPDEVAAIGEWASAKGLWVITDEIYEHFTYGDVEHTSMPVAVPEVAQRCIVINGVSKSYAMTGWRVGWMVAPEPVAAAAIRLQSQITTNVSNVSQQAALAALEGPQGDTRMMRDAFDRRRITMYGMLDGIDGVDCPEPEGAFYAFPNVEGLLGRSLAGSSASSSLEMAEIVLEHAKIALVPGEPFGAPGYVRFSFALSDADLEEGLGRFAALAAG